MKIDNRKQTIPNAIYIYIESILKELENNENSFVFPLPICYDFMSL